MMQSNDTARDDSDFHGTVGALAALSVLCFMGLILFV